jgi:hypothetical protein
LQPNKSVPVPASAPTTTQERQQEAQHFMKKEVREFLAASDEHREGHLAWLAIAKVPQPQPPKADEEPEGYLIHSVILKPAIARGELVATTPIHRGYVVTQWTVVSRAALRAYVNTHASPHPLVVQLSKGWDEAREMPPVPQGLQCVKRRPGPKKGSGGYDNAKKRLIPEVIERMKSPGATLHGVCLELAPRLDGGGTPESKARRLGSYVTRFEREGHPQAETSKL